MTTSWTGHEEASGESPDASAWASLLDQLESLGRTTTVKVLRYPFRRRSTGKLVVTVQVAECVEHWAWRRSKWVRIIPGGHSH